MSSTWHVPGPSLARYVDGVAGPIESDSIDAHLLACSHCRSRLAPLRPPSEIHERTWARIEVAIDLAGWRRRRWRIVAPLSMATPVLGILTVATAVVLLAIAVLAGLSGRDLTPLLVALAPVVPPLAAALAFRPSTDPAGSLAAATPLAAGRLPFLRAGVAAVAAIAMGLVASALEAVAPGTVVLWLAPSVALCAVVVAVATWANPLAVAATGIGGWAVAVVAWTWGHHGSWSQLDPDRLATARPSIQAALVVAAVVAVGLCVARRDVRPDWRTR